MMTDPRALDLIHDGGRWARTKAIRQSWFAGSSFKIDDAVLHGSVSIRDTPYLRDEGIDAVYIKASNKNIFILLGETE